MLPNRSIYPVPRWALDGHSLMFIFKSILNKNQNKEILSDLHSEINNKIKKIDDIKNDDSDSEMKPEWEEINKNDISNNTSYWNSWFY